MAESGCASVRNVIVIGKTGSGKTTLINKMIGKDVLEAKFSFSSVTKDIQQVAGLLRLGNEEFNTTFIDSVGVQDSALVEQKSNLQIILDIKRAISERFKSGVSVIIITLNLGGGGLTGDDKELFKLLKSKFKDKFWKLAYLVFTHCDLLTKAEVEVRINSFKTNPLTADIAKQFEDRVITVGFPFLMDLREELREKKALETQRDVAKLRSVLRKAKSLESPTDVVKSCKVM